jgi:hypothetical protein
MLPTKGRRPDPAPLSVEPLSASVDLLMKRMAPTLRFPIRKPRSPQAGLSPVVNASYRRIRLASDLGARKKPFSLLDENVLKQRRRYQ